MNKDEETISVTLTCEVLIPVKNWIEYLTKYSDIFGTTYYCGYWLLRIVRDDTGWLCWEHCDENSQNDHDQALKAFKEGGVLPPRYFRLDKDAAIKAYLEGCKRGGLGWFNQADGSDYDVAIQLALLGEIRYG